MSAIHDIRLLNPVSGADLTEELQQRSLANPLQLKLNIQNSTKDEGFSFKCMVINRSCFMMHLLVGDIQIFLVY